MQVDAPVSVNYRHTQVGYTLVAILGGVDLALVVAAIAIGRASPAFLVLLLVAAGLALCLYLFSAMTVSVDESAVHLEMLRGLLRRRYAFNEIAQARVVRNPWWYGWGIHGFPGGVLYNVSGWEAVELRLAHGRTVRLGSDEPQKLLAAIEAAGRERSEL